MRSKCPGAAGAYCYWETATPWGDSFASNGAADPAAPLTIPRLGLWLPYPVPPEATGVHRRYDALSEPPVRLPVVRSHNRSAT